MRLSKSKLKRMSGRELVELHRTLDEERMRSVSRKFAGEVKGIADRKIDTSRSPMDDIKAEIDRRVSKGDPELDLMAAENVERALMELPPDTPEGFLDLTPAAIARLSDLQLKATLRHYELQLSFHLATYDDAIKTEPSFGKIAIEKWSTDARKLLQLLRGEMLKRGLNPGSELGRSKSAGTKASPEVAKRRSIVANMRSCSDSAICRRFDLDSVPLPPGWDFPNWKAAHQSEAYRTRIHTIISKDRKSSL